MLYHLLFGWVPYLSPQTHFLFFFFFFLSWVCCGTWWLVLACREKREGRKEYSSFLLLLSLPKEEEWKEEEEGIHLGWASAAACCWYALEWRRIRQAFPPKKVRKMITKYLRLNRKLNWETLVKKAWRIPNRFPGRSKWKVGRRLFLSLRWQTKTKTKTAGSRERSRNVQNHLKGKHSGYISLHCTILSFAKNGIRKGKRSCEAALVWKPWSDFHAKKGTAKG